MSWHPGGPVGNPHSGPGFTGRNRQSSNGGPSGVQRSSAAQLRENESLFTTYEHLAGLPRGDSALTMLRKVASVVKPIMRKRGWRVQVLAEFLPPEQNLLGLNINKGYKICIRLRYHNNPDLFLPFEEVVDTMLHELSHIIWGEHDSNFHKLWDELRDEHEALVRKGYTGEGFLGEGKKLGGMAGNRPIPLHEMRSRARASAEKRKAQGTLSKGSGQRLGGAPIHLQGGDIRRVIADQVTRRNTINKGCGSGRKDADKLSQDASNNTFKTRAEEDDANNRAIAQALMELMEEEEERKLNGTFKQSSSSGGGLAWSAENGLYDASMKPPASNSRQQEPSEDEQLKWAMQESMQAPDADVAKPMLPPVTSPEPPKSNSAPPLPLDSKPPHPIDSAPIKRERPKSGSGESQAPADQWVCGICTPVNPMQFLTCDACGVERPQSVMATSGKSAAKEKSSQSSKTTTAPQRKPGRFEIPPSKIESLGWNCGNCGAFMEHKWSTCSACGEMKRSS